MRFQSQAADNSGMAFLHACHQLESLLLDLQARTVHPWKALVYEQSTLLAARIARAAQLAAEDYLEVYAKAGVRELPVSAEAQSASLFALVPIWLRTAKQAIADPDYRLDGVLPLQLPIEQGNWSVIHAQAFVALADRLHICAREAWAESAKQTPHAYSAIKAQLKIIETHGEFNQRNAQATISITKTKYISDDAKSSLQEAARLYYELLQALSVPVLFGYKIDTKEFAVGHLDWLPASPWCLTDPYLVTHAQFTGADEHDLACLWEFDPDPSATLAFKATIDRALRRRVIRVHEHRIEGNCPWPTVYLVRFDCELAGVALAQGDLFSLDMGAQGKYEWNFRRSIKVLEHLEAWQALGLPSNILARFDRADSATQLSQTPSSYMWELTDPAVRAQRQAEPNSVEQIERITCDDPSPRQTLALIAEIRLALRRRTIRYQRNASYDSCPWSATYLVRFDTTIGGRKLESGELFVCAIIDRLGKDFQRVIVPRGFLTPAEVLGLPAEFQVFLDSLS